MPDTWGWRNLVPPKPKAAKSKHFTQLNTIFERQISVKQFGASVSVLVYTNTHSNNVSNFPLHPTRYLV